MSVPELPIAQSMPLSAKPTTSALAIDVPRHATSRLAELGAQYGVSLLDIAVAAFQIVLARYLGQPDVAVATPAPGRKHPVVLRSRISDSATFVKFVREVSATVATSCTHSDIPFDRIVEELGLEPDLARSMVKYETESVPAAADVTVRLVKQDQDGDLSAVVEYRVGQFEPATVERLAAHVLHVLEVVAVDPAVALGDIDILTEAERHQILVEWNDTGRDIKPAVFADLFEAQVARTPDSPALLFSDGTLAYAELEIRANRLANLLIARGAGPEQIVALALPRSVDIVVAQLAVMKAGAAFLPVDPEYP
ncbi:MAG: AMP-binding protein, partial [Gammaproteobacteria bacterium]